MNMKEMQVQGIKFRNVKENMQDYMCISDIAKKFATDNKAVDVIILSWLRNKNTLEFLGAWEQINNPKFNPREFVGIRNEAGVHRFNISVKQWVEKTNAIGIFAKAGRYGGGTFAHYDIALEFASYLSPELKLYIIKEFQRIKQIEAQRLTEEWQAGRFLSKVNYRLQTDAVKNALLPVLNLPKSLEGFEYAKEADVINYAMFGMTAKQWKDANPNRKREENIRDYASPVELVILSNLEHKNAELINAGISKHERLKTLIEQANAEKKQLMSIDVKKLPLFNKYKE